MSKRQPLRLLIDAKCKDCIYDPLAGGKWREQVAQCTSTNCRLHSVRPVPKDCVSNGVINDNAVIELRKRFAA